MKKTLFAVLAATLCAAAPLAQSAPAAGAAFDRKAYSIAHKKFTLPNGLTLIVHEDHSSPVVAVNMWYHVGSRNEVRGKTGFAHLFEHFFFNGSENYPHGFREAMDDLGANNRNGTTNGDRTNFFEDVPTSALERTLFLESDRMGHLANYISKEMLERERGVVQNEKRQGENQPYGRVRLALSEHMYPYSHGYSWSTIGSMDDLNAASLDDIKTWYKTYYGPNNAVISLAGDITPDAALAMVSKYFGAIPPGPALPRTSSWTPKLESTIHDEMEDAVAQTRIYRSYHIPNWKDADTRYLSLLAGALAGSKTARLDKRLVYDKNLCTSVSAGVNDAEISGQFNITATLKDGVKVEDVEREIEAVLKELLDKGPTAAELARINTVAQAGFARSAERLGGMGGRSDILAEAQTYGGSPDAYLDQMELMAKATPAQVKAAGQKWLQGAHYYAMTVKPFPKLAAVKTGLDRKVLPALGEAPDVKFPAIAHAKLANGLKVMLIERHSAPIVNVALTVDAGLASGSAAKAGLASLAMDMLDKGSKTRNAFQLTEALENIGARMASASSLDQSTVRLQATSAKLAESIALMADAALAPAFAAEPFKQQQQRRLAAIGQEKAVPAQVATRLLPTLLFGPGHAYGNTALGTAASVQALTREDLAAWHATWFQPGSATLVVTGDTTLAQLMPMLEASFGKWKAGSAPAKALPEVARSAGKKLYLIDKPDAPQSLIVAAHISEGRGQPEDLAMEAVMSNFGGIATSRLNRNLRLDKHWSYGSSAQLMNVRGQRPFMVLAPVQTDKTKEAMLEVAKELRGIAGERPIVGEEFASTMRNMTARLPARFDTIAALEAAATLSVNLGLGDDYWPSYASRMRKLGEADLAAAAKKFIRPDEVVWMVIGDLRKVEAGVRELGWGEVQIINADGQPVQSK